MSRVGISEKTAPNRTERLTKDTFGFIKSFLKVQLSIVDSSIIMQF